MGANCTLVPIRKEMGLLVIVSMSPGCIIHEYCLDALHLGSEQFGRTPPGLICFLRVHDLGIAALLVFCRNDLGGHRILI